MDEEIKARMRFELIVEMQKWIDLQINKNPDDWCNGIGYVGQNIASQMANPAFSVLLAVSELNEYMKSEGLLKS